MYVGVFAFGSLAFVLSRTALSRPADTLVQPCGGAGDSTGPRASRRATLGTLRPRGSAGPTRTLTKCVYLRGQSQSANTSASWRPFHCGRRSRGIVLPWGAPSLAVESTILVANIKTRVWCQGASSACLFGGPVAPLAFWQAWRDRTCHPSHL